MIGSIWLQACYFYCGWYSYA